jgi:hypothetical protein
LKAHARSVRSLLPIFLIALVFFELLAYSTTTTHPQETYFQFYVLGSKENFGNYYPNNSSYLQVGENIEWNVGVTNRMGSIQLVSIRVKLGNQTIDPPNDTMGLPSPAPLLTEFERFVPNNQTWEFPLDWQMGNYTTSADGHVAIRDLQINNVTYALGGLVTCLSIRSCSFRLIIELWVWNVGTGNFQITWWNGEEERMVWLQLWFELGQGVIPPPPQR